MTIRRVGRAARAVAGLLLTSTLLAGCVRGGAATNGAGPSGGQTSASDTAPTLTAATPTPPGSTPAPSGPTPTLLDAVDFAGAKLTLPSGWRAMHYDNPTSFFQLSAYLGPDLVPDPCSRYANGMSCQAWPAITLPPNGILAATWYHGGPPGAAPDMTSGEPVTVGGRPGRLAVVDPRGCAPIGGDEQLRVVVPSQAIGNWEQLDACLRGPDHASNEALVRGLITGLPPGASQEPMSSDASVPNQYGFIEATGRLRLFNVTVTFPTGWASTRQPTWNLQHIPIATIGPPPVPTCANWATCGDWPAMQLPPSSIIVSVWISNNGDRTVASEPGTPITLAGHPGKLFVGAADPACSAIGGEELMTVVFQPMPQSPLTEIDACLRGPDLGANEAVFRAMLASAVASSVWTG